MPRKTILTIAVLALVFSVIVFLKHGRVEPAPDKGAKFSFTLQAQE